MSDITVGEQPQLRGHWLDRLPAIDADIAAHREEARAEQARREPESGAAAAIPEALGRPRRAPVACRHTPPAAFQPRQALEIEIAFEKKPASVRLYYRHVNHAERYETAEMRRRDNRWRAAIPATYTNSPYPLQYYFEIEQGPDSATLYPGLGPDLTNQPYFVVQS